MFVQLKSWFGDVWAEITSVYTHWDKPEMRSVSYVDYEKYGVRRKERSASFGDIRKFATADQINFGRDIVHTPDAHYSFGEKTEWPKGPHRRDVGGYEMHPRPSKSLLASISRARTLQTILMGIGRSRRVPVCARVPNPFSGPTDRPILPPATANRN